MRHAKEPSQMPISERLGHCKAALTDGGLKHCCCYQSTHSYPQVPTMSTHITSHPVSAKGLLTLVFDMVLIFFLINMRRIFLIAEMADGNYFLKVREGQGTRLFWLLYSLEQTKLPLEVDLIRLADLAHV